MHRKPLPHAALAAALALCAVLAPHAAGQEIVTKTDIPYGEQDGEPLLLDAVRPVRSVPEDPPLPALVLIHGGGWAMGSKEDFRWLAESLAREGYAAFSVNYRLVREDGNRWPAQLDDVQRAVRWIRAHAADHHVDPDRIGAVGGSAGGHLAAFLALAETRDDSDAGLAGLSSRVRCTVTLAAPFDLSDEAIPPEGPGLWVRGLVARLLGGPARTLPELYRAASPIQQVHEGGAPFLIVHGGADDVVPAAQASAFHEALEEAGVESRLVILPEEGHAFFNPASQQRVAEEMRAFLAKHLAPETP